MDVIQTHNVSKQYKNGVQALKGLSLNVKYNEIFTLLGENGAGKSTLIKILTTYLKPSSGNIRILESDILKHAQVVRSEIACVSQQTSIDTFLSLQENMLFQSRLYKIPINEAKSKMHSLIVDFGLEQYLDYPLSSYSGGVKRRLDIALNMMSNPKILFLDEPTVGMDVQSRKHMWDMMKKIRDDFKTTIFLTTHYLEEADQLSDTIFIMKDGKAIVQGTPIELRSYLRQDHLQVQFISSIEAKQNLSLLKKYFQNAVTISNYNLCIRTQDIHKDMEQILTILSKNHIHFNKIEIVQPTLEAVFLELTNKNKQEDE